MKNNKNTIIGLMIKFGELSLVQLDTNKIWYEIKQLTDSNMLERYPVGAFNPSSSDELWNLQCHVNENGIADGQYMQMPFTTQLPPKFQNPFFGTTVIVQEGCYGDYENISKDIIDELVKLEMLCNPANTQKLVEALDKMIELNETHLTLSVFESLENEQIKNVSL